LDFWINLGLILLWIGGWAFMALRYLSCPQSFNFRSTVTLKKNWVNFAATLLLLLLPFGWVNLYQDDGYFDYRRNFEKVIKDGDIADVLEFQEYAIEKYPYNVRVNIEYLMFATQNGLKSWLIERADYYKFQIEKGYQVDKFQLLSHIGALYSGLQRFEYTHGQEFDESLQSLYYFLLAEKEYKEGDGELAQIYFIKVLEDRELEDLAYLRLEGIWYTYYTLDEVAQYAYNMEIFPHMPFNLKRDIFIKDKAWGWYLFNGIYRDFLSADLPAYLGVGFSFFVWMLFISRMLFVRKTMWKFIVPIFLLGSILPVLVYVLSDLLSYAYDVYGIELKHNDLIYCVVDIGMVEELVKTIPWAIFYFAFRRHFHRPVHFMLLPVISALGFAFSENLIYVNSTDYELVFVRSAISLIIHISCSSIIGYMLWRANLKKGFWVKTRYILGGFLLASFLHGLFDYLIFNNMGYMNIIILLVTLHLFILFTNNAINFSGIKDKNAIRQLRHAGIILLVGMFATFLIQYLIIGWSFSSKSANIMFGANIIFVLVTTIYLVVMFSRIRLRPRILYKFSIADVFGQFMTTSKGNYMDEVDYRNYQFRLFAPKENPFVGGQLPIRATAVRRVVVQNDLTWWLIQFEKPLFVSGTDRNFAVIKAKEKDQDLFMDKVEIMMLMIPNLDEFNALSKHHSKDFIYTGRVYSRPLVAPMN
jgi:RsiW-degrading membrane proteinase PrsW (M82 family)